MIIETITRTVRDIPATGGATGGASDAVAGGAGGVDAPADEIASIITSGNNPDKADKADKAGKTDGKVNDCVKKTDEKDGECCSDGVTNKGILESAKVKAGIAAAVAVYNTTTALRMAKLQRDIGNKYLSLAKEYRNYYNKYFKPLEEQLVAEVSNLPLYKRTKERMHTGQFMVSSKLSSIGVADDSIACTGRYCTGVRAAILDDQLLKEATLESTAAGLAFRFTNEEEDVRNDLRWKRRGDVLRLGNNLPSEATTYADMASNAFGSIGDQAGRAAEGIIRFLGFGFERRETIYPEKHGDLTVWSYNYLPTRSPLPDITPPKVAQTGSGQKVEVKG